jgi:hypothetical protein
MSAFPPGVASALHRENVFVTHVLKLLAGEEAPQASRAVRYGRAVKYGLGVRIGDARAGLAGQL